MGPSLIQRAGRHASRSLAIAVALALAAARAQAADGQAASEAANTWTDYPPAALAPVAPITPATVQSAIQAACARERGLWDDFDLDHDGKVSQLEVVAMIAKRPRWLRAHCPALFSAIDTDQDGAVCIAELQAFAARIDPPLFSVGARQPTLAGPGAGVALGAAGGAAAAGVDAGVGGAEASAAFMRQQAYISGYEVVGGQYQPVIGVLGYGTVLTVGEVVITVVHQAP